MTEPLDVALRVKFDYQNAGAKAALADGEALRALGSKMGAAPGSRLAADLAAVAAPAAAARRDVAAVAAEVSKLGRTTGSISGDGLQSLSREAIAARRAIAETMEATARLGTTGGGAKAAADLGRMTAAAAAAERAVDDLLASGEKLQAWTPAQAAAAMAEFDAQIKSGTGRIGAMEEAANRLASSPGPSRLADEVAAVSPVAAEVRREIDAVGRSAVRAGRDIAGMGQAGGGGGLGGGGGGGGGGAHGGAGGGGLRAGAIAAARPLHMERLVMSAMTPGGAAGLGLGLGAFKAYEGLKGAAEDAIKLETAMAELRQSVGDMPAEGLKALEGSILRTSRATGVATGELAQLSARAAAAGRPVAELPEFMELGARAAGGFGEKVGEVAEQLTRVGAQFSLDQRGLRSTADAAALLQEKTGVRGGNTLEFMSQTGDLARLAGMRPDQLAAYGATLGQAGFGAGDAASTFSGLLNKLQTAPQQGEGFQLGLSRMAGPDGRGESAWGLRNLARADPSAAMLRMLDDIKKLPQERRVSVLTQMFGAEDGEKLARMADHVDGLRRNLGLMNDTAARSGAVDRVFRIFDETTSSKIDRATAAIGAFSTKIGQALAPAIGAMADATARLFNSLSDVIDRGERATQAVEILNAKRAGQPLTEGQKAAIGADPALKGMVGGPDDKVPPLAPSLVPQPPVPRSGQQPELSTGEVSAARARAREQLEGRVRELEGQKAVGAGGYDVDRQIEGARRRLRQFDGPEPGSTSDGARPSGLLHRTSFSDDDAPSSSGSATEALQAVIASGTKEGVVAGLREVMEMRGGTGASGGVMNASFEDGGASAGPGGGGGLPNLRYGRASRGAPNMRYGSAGGRVRGTPAGRAHGAYRASPGSSGGWRIGAGDGSATTEDGGPGFTSGMKARNLGNIGYFGQHETGLVGPSNSRDVDHSIAMYATQEDGIRAAARLAMRKYQSGMHDTASLIAAKKGGWTPGALGPAASVNIAKAMGLSNKDDLHLDQPGQMQKFLGALARQEHGSAGAYYSPEMIDRALKGSGPAPANAERSVGSSDRRGFANLMHGQYGGPGQNLTSVTTPDGKTVRVHAAAADSFRGFLGDLEKSGYNINSLGGYANRGMAGNPGRISQHAYGNAIDINPAQNPFHTSQTDLPKNVSDMAAKWGLSWGGDWSERSRDPMHFEWNGSRPWENKQGPVAGPQNKPNVMPFGLTGSALVAMDKARADKAAAAGEDRATRSTADERVAAAERHPTVSPRFADPSKLKIRPRPGDITASAGGAGAAGMGGGGHGTTIQHFYGNHDPAQTARYAQLEQNREIRRTTGRALHGVGRVA